MSEKPTQAEVEAMITRHKAAYWETYGTLEHREWADEAAVMLCALASRADAVPHAESTIAPPEPRPHLRDDGFPTRADMRFWTPAEHAIRAAMDAVEHAGASRALTDAVTLLGEARDRVADHVEGKP